MKLNSIEPNAHYDIAHGMPAVLEKDNDGSVIYRVNIAEEKPFRRVKRKPARLVGHVMKSARSRSLQRQT